MKEKRKSWPRWTKVLRNLLLTLLLGLMMWDAWGRPTFSYMVSLRRIERQALFPEPEMVMELDAAHGVKYRIDIADDMAVTSYLTRGRFFTNANASFHPLEEGPNLLCVSRPVELRDEAGQPLTYAAFVAVRPPENSVDAALTLHIDGEDYIAGGVREGEVFLFYARPEPDEDGIIRMSGSWYFQEQFTYELEFFDKDGNRICQVSG